MRVLRVLVRVPALTAAVALAAVLCPAPALAAAPASGASKPVGHVGVSSVGDRAVAEAVKHLGAPYVFGAAGPDAFDCSGLVQYVFGQVGVSLPRSSGDQYAAARHVAQTDRRAGDLIFFRTGGSVSHVGIYVGNNQIVVAPKSGDHVRYETIWTGAYSVGRVG